MDYEHHKITYTPEDYKAGIEEKLKYLKTTLPKDWVLPLEWKKWGVKELGSDLISMHQEADKFIDYHISRGSSSANWFASWKVWVRRQLEYKARLTGKKLSTTTLGSLCPSCGKKLNS